MAAWCTVRSMHLRVALVIALGASACGGSSSTPDAPVASGSGTTISGTLGDLGAAQPTVSSLMIANSGETLIYLSSGPITCDELMVSRWLGGTMAGTQVVELVFHGTPALGDIQVPPGEVNYAPGGMSSSHEVSADSGKITFTEATANTSAAGTFTGTYGGSDTITGSFHATFCAGGQGF